MTNNPSQSKDVCAINDSGKHDSKCPTPRGCGCRVTDCSCDYPKDHEITHCPLHANAHNLFNTVLELLEYGGTPGAAWNMVAKDAHKLLKSCEVKP